MAIVKVHPFRVPALRPGVAIEQGDIKPKNEFDMELNLAAVLRQNALAVPYRGPLLMRLVNREMALIVSMFGRTPPGTRLTRHEAFESSSSHIRRFTTEVFALGALTACVETTDEPIPRDSAGPLTVAHFDALPEALKAVYPRGGVRPDLRFARDEYVVAGEARGRNKTVPTRLVQEQVDRLNQLLTWRRRPGCDPVCMAWSWIQQKSTVIDFFTFTPDRHNEPMRIFSVRKLESAVLDLTEALKTDDADVGTQLGSAESPYPYGYNPLPYERAVSLRYRELRAKRELIHRSIEECEIQLIESAPEVPVVELDRPWYGEWHPTSPLDDRRNCNVLLATSQEGRQRPVSSSDEDLQDLSRDLGMEVSMDGRTMVAIDWQNRSTSDAAAALVRLVHSRF